MRSVPGELSSPTDGSSPSVATHHSISLIRQSETDSGAFGISAAPALTPREMDNPGPNRATNSPLHGGMPRCKRCRMVLSLCAPGV
jgi:hypothetical protein